MDYGYLLEGAETDGSMPLWCAKGTEHPYNVQEVKRQILAGGFTKVILRSDGEHPILALKTRLLEKSRREGVEVIMSEA
eukprot:4002878-Amphidinium_carterae.1